MGVNVQIPAKSPHLTVATTNHTDLAICTGGVVRGSCPRHLRRSAIRVAYDHKENTAIGLVYCLTLFSVYRESFMTMQSNENAY